MAADTGDDDGGQGDEARDAEPTGKQAPRLSIHAAKHRAERPGWAWLRTARILYEAADRPGGSDGPDGSGDGAEARRSIVQAAVGYLASITATDGGVPWVLPSVMVEPRAPWWQTGDDSGRR